MVYVLSKVLWLVVEPGNLLVLILVVGVIALLVRWRRIGTVLVAIATLCLVAIAVTPVAYWALAPLENRFPEPSFPAHVDGIIVLGGAVSPGLSYLRHRPQIFDAAGRVIETAELARRYPDARIVIAGGNPSLQPNGLNEADPTRDMLVSLGIPETHMILDTKSRNTIENAEIAYALAKPKPGETWLLVTSAFHMPRAVGCFRHVGWTIVPYVVNYHTHPRFSSRPDLSARLLEVSMAAREWIGLVAYYYMGRIDTLFPAP